MGDYVLLVEGKADQEFHQAFCQAVGLTNVSVKVITPSKLAAESGDGWRNLIDNLPLALKELIAGNFEKLGIILDADFQADNSGGVLERYRLVTQPLQAAGYHIPSSPDFGKGDIFSHADGLPAIGLWIMPDHQNEGMLELFIETLITAPEQKQLLHHADQAINTLPIYLFDRVVKSAKAKIYTWRAWQKQPSDSLANTFKHHLLDTNAAPHFSNWLQNVFN